MVSICYCLLQAKFLFLRILKARCATLVLTRNKAVAIFLLCTQEL